MRYFVFILAVVAGARSFAANEKGLTIHAAEIGVAKFHRYDNKQHPYGGANAWSPFILADGAEANTPIVFENADHSVTILFSTLDELLKEMAELSAKAGLPISVLNINGHGLPGGMWFPVDERTMNSFACMQWLDAARGNDKANYEQYYSAVSKEEIMQMRDYSNTGGTVPCVTGLAEWKKMIATNKAAKAAFAPNMRINFLSCIVGLGKVGEAFTSGLAAVLFDGKEASIHSSMNFGLGDWSMPEGMGFWDYQNDQQLAHDNSVYPVNRSDREIAQKGQVRVTTFDGAKWGSKVIENQDFMKLDNSAISGSEVISTEIQSATLVPPTHIRIPGTRVVAPVGN